MEKLIVIIAAGVVPVLLLLVAILLLVVLSLRNRVTDLEEVALDLLKQNILVALGKAHPAIEWTNVKIKDELGSRLPLHMINIAIWSLNTEGRLNAVEKNKSLGLIIVRVK